MLKFGKNNALVKNRVHAPFREDPSFRHFLHREKLVVLFHDDLPHLAKAALSNAVEEVEVGLEHDDRLLVGYAVGLELAIPHINIYSNHL